MTDLYKEEYETLRREVEAAMSELNKLESGILLAIAAIFSWLATHEMEGVMRLGWFIPATLVGFGIIRAWTLTRHLGWLGDYLKGYETAFIQSKLRGWEHFLTDSPAGSSKPRRGFRGQMTLVLWGVLVLVTLAGGVSGYINI